jgi:hypothetical protein
MCLIVNNPTGAPLNELRMRTAYANNRDGVGFMWHDSEGTVRSERGLFTFTEFWDLHQVLLGVPHAIHFRLRTRGKVHEEQCHPFQVLNSKDDGVDLYMMHNGTLNGIPSSASESDTFIFARELRNKIRTWDDPMEILSPVLLQKLANNIGSGNKFVFYGSGGVTRLVNSKAGWFDCAKEGALEIDSFDGNETPTWYSNQYSFYGLDPDTWYTTPAPKKDYSKWDSKYSTPIVGSRAWNELKEEKTQPRALVAPVKTSATEWAKDTYPTVVRRKDGVDTPIRFR